MLTFFAVVALISTASAEIVFTLTPASPGDIALGNDALFNLYIRATPIAISNLDGIDFSVDAADPDGEMTLTAGGHFVSATSDFYTAIEVPNPYQIPFPTSVALFSANANGDKNLGTTDTLLASLRLSTVGATPGTYQMGLSKLTALYTTGDRITVSDLTTSSISYTIAVPEPSSLLFVAIAGIAAMGYRSRRKFHPRKYTIE